MANTLGPGAAAGAESYKLPAYRFPHLALDRLSCMPEVLSQPLKETIAGVLSDDITSGQGTPGIYDGYCEGLLRFPLNYRNPSHLTAILKPNFCGLRELLTKSGLNEGKPDFMHFLDVIEWY